MKRFLTTLCLSAGLILATAAVAQTTAPAGTVKPAAAAKTTKPKLQGEYAMMASTLSLSDEQTATLASRIDAKAAALKAWDESDGKGIPDLEKALKDATVAKDKAKVTALSKQINDLRAPRIALAAKYDKEIAAVLTHQQAENWEGFKAYRSLMSALTKAQLTDDQKTTIRDKARQSGPALLNASTDMKAKAAITKDLHDSVVKDVLTADQRTALTAKPAMGAAKAPAAAPAATPAPATK